VDYYPPFEIYDAEGNYEGLGSEYLARIGKTTGLNFKILTGLSWTQVLDGAKNGTVDLIPVITDSTERRKYLLFTDGYLYHPQVIITRKRHPDVTGVADLNGKTMAVSRGYSEVEDLDREFPAIKQLKVRDSLEELQVVSSGQADACQGNLAVLSYYINKHNLVNLKVAGPSDIGGEGAFAIGIRKDWPLLHSIIQKGLKAIGEAEQIAISRKWTPDLLGSGGSLRQLTAAERAWLKQHPVMRLGVEPNWAPVEYYDTEGRLAGITSDNIRILSQHLGTRFEPVQGLSWEEVLQLAKEGKIDVVSAINQSEARARYLRFTAPYLRLPMVIVTRDDYPVIEGISDLHGKTIAVVKGFITEAYLKRDFPGQQLLLCKSLDEALQAVAGRKADAVVENAPAINLARNRLGLKQLTVASSTPYTYELSFGVRKDWPELIPILEKSLASITEREKQIIREKWVNIQFERQVNW
jgi:ABC-type amino acid transport substrate-binding protein